MADDAMADRPPFATWSLRRLCRRCSSVAVRLLEDAQLANPSGEPGVIPADKQSRDRPG